MNRHFLQFFNRAMTLTIAVAMMLPLGIESPSRAALQEAPSPSDFPGSRSEFPHKMMQTAADAENVEFVSQIGVDTYAVALQGDYAYIGEGYSLTILDISNPASPTVVGKTSPFPEIVRGVCVIGDYAYVADGWAGLRVVDISTPSSPTEVGFYDTPYFAGSVAVSGGHAYIADGEAGLRVVDVSTPTNPTEAGFYDTPGYAEGVAVAGGYAYIADGWAGLRVVDVSTPANPTEVGSYNTPGMAEGVAIAGGYTHVADGSGGLRVVDISNPTNPTEVGFYDTPGWAEGVAVAGDYAYVADREDGGLRIVDVSIPVDPMEVGSYDTPGSAKGIAVSSSGCYAYMADGSEGLLILLFTGGGGPCNVEFVGHIGGTTCAVAVQGDYAYFGEGPRLVILDISNPASPTVVGKTPLLPDIVQGMAVAGGYAYVADGWDGGLRVVDVSNPANPTEVGFYNTPGYADGVAVAGDYTYVADGDGGLRVVDISDPFSPTEVGFYDTPEWISSVAVAGDYAYVADYLAGLRMVDVSDPASPTEVGFYDMPGYARGVAIAGDYAYVADEWSGLRVVDVSDPASPTEVGFYDMLGWAYGVAVTGDYAYVADRDGGLRVVDVSDPASPTEVGSCDTPGYARDVAVAGNYAYVADGDGGLIILRFTSGAQTFSISGHVHNGSDNPIPGVTVSAGTGGSATTDASGAYTIINVMTGTYTLTPSKSGWMFTPASRMVNVPPSATGRDFMGSSETLLVSLSADPSEGTVPLNDVDLAAEVSGSAVGTINYTFYCNRSDAGTNITPDWDAKFDGVFDNPKTAVDVCDYSTAGTHTAKVIAERGSKQAEDRVTIDVSGAPTFSVSGHVHDGSGKPISGVTVSGASGSASTDASGAYTITGFITGTYTITPSKSGWTFTPATRAVSVPPGATGQDFTGYDRPPIVLVHGFQGLGVPWNCDDHDPNNTFQEVDDWIFTQKVGPSSIVKT